MEEENKNNYYIRYKIMATNSKGEPIKYRVYTSSFGDKKFYKIRVAQKNYDETTSYYYINVTFKKGTEPIDSTGKGIDIYIKKAFETLRENPNDKYSPIHSLVIMEYENPKREEEVKQEAYDIFRGNLEENENNYFQEFGEEVMIDDNFLE